MSFIQANLDNYTVKQMCKVLKFPRSTYYAVINHVTSQREIDYNKFSDEVKYYYDKSKGRYGAIKIQRDLEEAGIPCSVKRVQRHMAKLGLRSVVVRKYKYQNNQGKVPDDKENILNRDFTTTTINQKWVTDITYIHVLKEGWTYLASVMDLYNRKIIGYSYGKNPTAELAKKAVENACLNVEDTTGIILHSDLGSQYTSAVFEDMLIEKNIKHSFSRKGNPYDNACMESDDAWYMWYWDDKVVPLYLSNIDEDEMEVINWFTTKKHSLFVEKDKHYILPNFYLFKRDILEKLYEVDKNIWLEEIEKIEFSENILQEIYLNFVELLAAYDITKSEVYYDVAERMIDKVLKVLPEDEYGIINKMQLLKRKRNLSEEEILKLEEIEEKSDNSMTKCAVNILLDNKRKAQRLISELPEKDQKDIMGFPIYNLL